MLNTHLQRAQLLLEQSRTELAITELRQEITLRPQNALAHALLALCLSREKQSVEALREAQWAVHLAPDTGFCHYVRGLVLNAQDKHREAEAAVNEAIRLDARAADFFALRAQIALDLRQWSVALQAAETGLRIDPEHIDCANLRAVALVKLGQRDTAAAVIDSALARDPENDITHANRGWAYLERGDHVRALEHFREALRLNPESEWARAGVIRALNARNPVYRLMLRYFFLMGRLSRRAQWGFILGGYFAVRILREVGHAYPALEPIIWPVLGVYFVVVFLTWTATPLFNLLLRLDRFGRLVLTKEQIVASNLVGTCLAGGLIALDVWLLKRSDTAFWAMILCALMMIPISATFSSRLRPNRLFLAFYTTGLGTVGVLALAGMALFGESVGDLLIGVFLLGFVLFSWIANGLSS